MKTTPLRATALVLVALTTFAVVGCSSSDDAAQDVKKSGDTVANDLSAGASTIVDDLDTGLDDQWSSLRSAAHQFDTGATDLPSDLQTGWDRLLTDIRTNVDTTTKRSDADAKADWAKLKSDADSFDHDLTAGADRVGDDTRADWDKLKSEIDRLDANL